MNVSVYSSCAKVNYYTFKWPLKEVNKRMSNLKVNVNLQNLRQNKGKLFLILIISTKKYLITRQVK